MDSYSHSCGFTSIHREINHYIVMTCPQMLSSCFLDLRPKISASMSLHTFCIWQSAITDLWSSVPFCLYWHTLARKFHIQRSINKEGPRPTFAAIRLPMVPICGAPRVTWGTVRISALRGMPLSFNWNSRDITCQVYFGSHAPSPGGKKGGKAKGKALCGT